MTTKIHTATAISSIDDSTYLLFIESLLSYVGQQYTFKVTNNVCRYLVIASVRITLDYRSTFQIAEYVLLQNSTSLPI